MNKVILVGRFTRDPEVRYSQSGVAVARFSVAVDRRFKKDGQPDADFPNCIAFGKTAEFIEKYFHKGMRIGIEGRITTGSYTNKEGNKVYTTEVTVEQVEFVESKSAGGNQGGNNQNANTNQTDSDGFMNIPDQLEEELPFI